MGEDVEKKSKEAKVEKESVDEVEQNASEFDPKRDVNGHAVQTGATELADEQSPSKSRSKTESSQKCNDSADSVSTSEKNEYSFDRDGVLRDEQGIKFKFNVYPKAERNQRRYEEIGKWVTEEVYRRLVEQCGLVKHFIPIGAKETDPRSFVFASEDFETNEDVLLVLIHGTGVVRAGQWSRSVIINQGIKEGTQIPYIETARENNWAVLVLNTNLNMAQKRTEDQAKVGLGLYEVKGSETAEEHAQYVWKTFISKCKAKTILIVAHSFGGVVTARLAEKNDDFLDRVAAVALTDSVHALRHMDVKKDVEKFYEDHVINWVAAPEEVNTPLLKSRLTPNKGDCPCRSAGHLKHEMTSHCAKDSIFTWFFEKINSL